VRQLSDTLRMNSQQSQVRSIKHSASTLMALASCGFISPRAGLVAKACVVVELHSDGRPPPGWARIAPLQPNSVPRSCVQAYYRKAVSRAMKHAVCSLTEHPFASQMPGSQRSTACTDGSV
jgi:hypothetical protein